MGSEDDQIYSHEKLYKKSNVYKDEKISNPRRKKDVEIAKRNHRCGTRYLIGHCLLLVLNFRLLDFSTSCLLISPSQYLNIPLVALHILFMPLF